MIEKKFRAEVLQGWPPADAWRYFSYVCAGRWWIFPAPKAT